MNKQERAYVDDLKQQIENATTCLWRVLSTRIWHTRAIENICKEKRVNTNIEGMLIHALTEFAVDTETIRSQLKYIHKKQESIDFIEAERRSLATVEEGVDVEDTVAEAGDDDGWRDKLQGRADARWRMLEDKGELPDNTAEEVSQADEKGEESVVMDGPVDPPRQRNRMWA